MFIKPYSEATATIIDEETSKLIEKAYGRAREILSEHLNPLKIIAERLLEKEVLFKEDLEDILGPRPYGDKPAMNTLLAQPEAPTEPEAPEA
jgi:cell division protease FtsH